MGKRIIAQRRGSGSTAYRSPSFKYKGAAKFPTSTTGCGTVKDIIHCRGHSAPLMVVEFSKEKFDLMIAPELVRVGDILTLGETDIKQVGNIITLRDLPDGTHINNIEGVPGDGGKFVRASGTSARVVGKLENGNVAVILPSKKKKIFHGNCRACVGVVAGGGRTDKPIMRAGNAHFKYKAKNQIWPKVSGGAMNAVDHPFGNKRSSRKSKAKPVSRHAPPGRKVGYIAAKIMGQSKKRSKQRGE